MRLVLPSGARVELSEREPSIDPPPGVFAEELAGVRASFRRGSEPLGLGELPLSDLHTLRAILRRTGDIAEPAHELVCENCGEVWEVLPCAELELGPYKDDELDDEELDAPFEFAREHPIEPGDPRFSSVELAPVSVADAAALHQALAGRFRITSHVVRAMGIVKLGSETSPARIARRLAAAPDEIFDRVAQLFEDAHYPPRLVAAHSCPKCQMVAWLPIPVERELTVAAKGAPSVEPPAHGAFPDADAFEQRVRPIADRVYRELGVRAIDLCVIEGPAECDDAGEPLLGCYLPPDPEGLIPRNAAICLYYRTFAAIWTAAEYDIDAEIEETLRHEIEHHFGFLAGSDPLDDAEHAEIGGEARRRIGRRETERRAVRAFTADIGEFARRTWPLWLVAAAATLLAVASAR